ncbi:MAG: hypothetical protein V4628_14895 [Pseudomonadota bacterium]
MTSKPDFSKTTVAPSFRHPVALLFLVFVLGLIFATWRFGPWMPDVFFGDDLVNLLSYKEGYFPGTTSAAWTVAFMEKYRPIFVSLSSAMFGAFDDTMWAYLAVNVLVQGLNTAIAFAIAHKLSHGNMLVSLAVAVAVATSRFALYQVTQVTGFLEAIALTFFLFMTYCMVHASNANQQAAWRWSWLALLMAFLVINTHERYIGVAAWLCLALLVLPGTRALPLHRLLTLLGACVGIVLLNVFFKVLVLDMPFFVGTGGTHMDLDLLRVLDLVRQAVLSIFGFNEGPEYLIGTRAITLGWSPPVMLLAAAFTLAWVIAIVAGVRTALREPLTASDSRWQLFCWPLLLLILGGLMLGPPALTIRMEQRWVFAPFIVTLLIFAWAVGVQRQRTIVPVGILAAVIGFGTVISDTLIAAHFEQIFFVTSGRLASITKRDIVDTDPLQSTPLAFLTNGDHCSWGLFNGEFFRLYGGNKRTVSCFNSVDELTAAGLPENTHIYGLNSSPLRFIDVTSELATRGPDDETVTSDFLALFPQGSISDPRAMESPSGMGAMVMPLDTFLGHRNTLTVISGFSYSYDAVTIEPNTSLRFGITMVYPSQESARASVRIEEEGAEPRVVYSQDLVPPNAGEKLQFQAVNISLADFADKKVSVTFSIETLPGKDSSGHWGAFSEPRIVLDATP